MFRAAASLGIAAVGGGVSLLGAGVTGHLGTSTTVSEVLTSTMPIENVPSHELSIEQLYRRDAPGVVEIVGSHRRRGSGFVIDKAGHIVTNEHVIAGAHEVQVSFSGTHPIAAKVIGTDASTDVAVLQIKAHSRSLTPLPLGDSDGVQAGDTVVAIGNPFSMTRIATAGIVSAVERTIDASNGFSIAHAIQTDAAINGGNSGGPLIDADGDVIGVNAEITPDTIGNVGIGFAIPINTVKAAAAQLIRNGKVRHVYLGVAAQPVSPSLARLFDLPVSHGLLVQSVTPGSAAARAGLRAGSNSVLVGGESYALGGDIIVDADGKPVSTQSQLRQLLTVHEPGDRLALSYYRGPAKRHVEVTLGRPPG